METVHGLWVETSKSRRYKSSRESRLNPYSWGLDPQILMVTSPCLMIRSLILLNVCGWNPKQNQHLVLNFLPKINILSNFSVSASWFFGRSMERWAPPCSSSLVLRSLPRSGWGNNTRVNRTLGRFSWEMMFDDWWMVDDWWLLQMFVLVKFVTWAL